MDEQSKELLEKTLELTKENNHILRSMRRSQFWSNVVRSIYWVFIIGTAVGAYYYIEPYIKPIISGFQSSIETVNKFRNIGQ